jgi:hypothetical protein
LAQFPIGGKPAEAGEPASLSGYFREGMIRCDSGADRTVGMKEGTLIRSADAANPE